MSEPNGKGSDEIINAVNAKTKATMIIVRGA